MNGEGFSNELASPVVMFLSAAIFAFFGFYVSPSPTDENGQIVLIWALLFWTLRVGAVAMLVSAVATIVRPIAGNLLYALVGLLLSLAFLSLAALDIADNVHASALPPFLAIIFGIWFGYGSWIGLRESMRARPRAANAQ